MILRYPVGILLFAAGVLLENTAGGVPSMVLFFAAMAAVCWSVYRENKNIIDLRLLLSLSWLSGIALSVLKLSTLQRPWGAKMWISVGGFFFLFLVSFDLALFLIRKREKSEDVEKKNGMRKDDPVFRRRILICITGIIFLAVVCFLIECVYFGWQIPLISEWSYAAYFVFHLTGIHYFVVLPVLVPPLTVYFIFLGKVSKAERNILLVCNIIAFLIPFLLLSKMQMLITMALPVMTFLLIQEKIPRRKVMAGTLIFCAAVAVIFFVLMLLKKYPEGYLESVFRFKSKKTPLPLQYPYIYIVNNLENLNVLTEKLEHYSYGIRQLYPFFALTGLKFRPAIAEMMAVEQYRTVEELTTLSLLYDVYGDFGCVGALGFGCVLGPVSAVLSWLAYKRKSVLGVLLYVQFAFYMGLAFFTTWFSNPTTWFYFVITAMIGIFVKLPPFRKKEKEKT